MFACMNSANWTARRDYQPGHHLPEVLARCTSVARFSDIGHQRILIELSRLVVGRFEDRCTSHCGLGGRNDGEVFTTQP